MSLVDELAPGAAGLQQLRAMMNDPSRLGIGATMQFRLTEIDDGWAVFSGVPGRHVYNPIGTVHGGYAATLLDSACGCAVHSKLGATQGYTTLELKVAFHKAMSADTGLVRAEGRVVTMGRRTAFAEAKIIDAGGRLYASATSTLLVFER
jgi:uncharacterized protein (TIGR00369 family)